MDLSFPLIPVPGNRFASSNEAWEEAAKYLAILVIEDMEANMIWVCAECGADIVYPGDVCLEDEYHQGQIKREDWEAKERRKEVAQQDIEDMFGPKDMR